MLRRSLVTSIELIIQESKLFTCLVSLTVSRWDGIGRILEEHRGMSYVIRVIIPNLVVVLDSQVKIFRKRHKIEREVANRRRQAKKSALQINGLLRLDNPSQGQWYTS
jgi:hypothetical protein